jgi:hypothetical protein
VILDALLNFTPNNVPISLVTGAVGSVQSPNTIDILGSGVGTAPVGQIIGNRTVFGSDVGIGGIRAQFEVLVTTAFTSGGAATLNIQYQGAIDTGAAGNYQPGTWTTLEETGPIALATLALNAKLARYDFAPSLPENFMPRYLRLNFVIGTAVFTAGQVLAPVTLIRDDTANRFMPSNYVVA